MKWIFSNSKNRLHRHDLRGLDLRTRTRLRNQRQTKILWKIFVVIVIGGGLGWGLWLEMKSGLRKMFSENPHYQIEDIVVQSSGNVLKSEQVIGMLAVRRGQNLLALDLEELRRQLELNPVVEKAEVFRQFPNRLAIRVMERIPVANITVGVHGPHYQIDRQGVVMDLLPYQKNAEGLHRRLATLPNIIGARVADLKMGRTTSSPEIFQALTLIQIMDHINFGFSVEINSIDVSRRNILVMNTADGMLIKVSVSGMEKQLRRLVWILNDANQRSLKVATVDLTVERDVPVTFASVP